MSEKQNNQPKQDAASDQSYSFYWNYNDQLAHDREEKEKRSRRGVLVYVTVLVAVFLLSFAMLAATIVWYGEGGGIPPVTPQTNTGAVAEAVNPSVVLISAASAYSAGNGTGFFLSTDGYIATNYHVIAAATAIRVTLYNGEILDAKLIGYRAEDDLAVIKIDGRGYPAVTIGNSDVLAVGDIAIAIGNPGGAEGGWTTTQGIISALNRTISIEETAYFSEMKMLQTDAQVNPGNSGGPLCNASGEVIGVITRKISDYEGIGYAIPINEAILTLNAIMEGKLDGFVSSVSKSRPKVGITGSEITKGEKFQLEFGGEEYTAPVPGFFVTAVSQSTGAYGVVEVGDIICAVNDKTITDLESFKTELYKCYVGQKVTFDLYRKNEKMTVEITLGVT